MCVNYFAKKHGIHFDKKKGNARIGQGEVNGVLVTVARPQTFMNASGKSVNSLLKMLKINSDDLIVIHDDLDLPLGRVRIRKGGSSGGHKGVQSIIGDTGSAEFIRVRIGIGRPDTNKSGEDNEDGVINYVLGSFSVDENFIIEKIIPWVNEAIECLIFDGLVSAMDRFNSIHFES
jgi:PTH1 family peptidyl-tRNA hydrolase